MFSCGFLQLAFIDGDGEMLRTALWCVCVCLCVCVGVGVGVCMCNVCV